MNKKKPLPGIKPSIRTKEEGRILYKYCAAVVKLAQRIASQGVRNDIKY